MPLISVTRALPARLIGPLHVLLPTLLRRAPLPTPATPVPTMERAWL